MGSDGISLQSTVMVEMFAFWPSCPSRPPRPVCRIYSWTHHRDRSAWFCGILANATTHSLVIPLGWRCNIAAPHRRFVSAGGRKARKGGICAQRVIFWILCLIYFCITCHVALTQTLSCYYGVTCVTCDALLSWCDFRPRKIRKKKRYDCNCRSTLLLLWRLIIGHVSHILRKRLTDKDARFERKLGVCNNTHLCAWTYTMINIAEKKFIPRDNAT